MSLLLSLLFACPALASASVEPPSSPAGPTFRQINITQNVTMIVHRPDADGMPASRGSTTVIVKSPDHKLLIGGVLEGVVPEVNRIPAGNARNVSLYTIDEYLEAMVDPKGREAVRAELVKYFGRDNLAVIQRVVGAQDSVQTLELKTVPPGF